LGHVFAPVLPAEQVLCHIAGLLLLAAATSTSMVFWSNICEDEPHNTLSQVALAPFVGLLFGVASITVPWDMLLLSAALYIVVPVLVAQLGKSFAPDQCANYFRQAGYRR
jgi:arsenite transporter